jgi:hypothetical protein
MNTMTKRFWLVLTAVGLCGTVLLGRGPVPKAGADDKKTEAVKHDPAADDVRHIAMAYELAEYGRETKSPEMLIAAARILRKIHATPGKEKSTVERGKEEAGDNEPVSLVKESDKLLAEARNLAPDDSVITQLVERTSKEKSRGAIGGPRSYFHRPGAGTTISTIVRFWGAQPASVAVTGNGRNSLTLTVTGPGGFYLTWTGPHPSLNWVPNAPQTYTITVTNNGPGAVGYTLYTN